MKEKEGRKAERKEGTEGGKRAHQQEGTQLCILLLMIRPHLTQILSSYPWVIIPMVFLCSNKSHKCI